MFWILQIVNLGIKSLMLHKLRSALTTLGIVFGVCSVIAMLSIGEGASHEAQERIRLLGTNNIIARSLKPPEESKVSARSRLLEYGLTHQDVELILATISSVEEITRIRDLRQEVRYLDRRAATRVFGTEPNYQRVLNLNVAKGRFLNVVDTNSRANVCVLSKGVAQDLFRYADPLGGDIRIGSDYYRVVGVMQERMMSDGQSGVKDGSFDRDVYVPLSAAQNRLGEIIMKRSSGSLEFEKVQLHQINIRIREGSDVLAAAGAIRRVLESQHTKEDYEMVVPLELLREAEATKRMFNIVLGSIAAISLLVGGIGIMNIMLATIIERTREIGIRRALGAKRRDITTQFLVETILLTCFGGTLGIGLGIFIPHLVTKFAGMPTIVRMDFLVMAFTISAGVGIIFGLYPAWRAANMDPIEALRHE